MRTQPKYTPLDRSWFFKDERSARPIPAGAVALGEATVDPALATGLADGAFVKAIPVPVTPALLSRGEERFRVYCSPCHGRSGTGDGIVVQYGFKRPPDLRSAGMRSVAPGFIYTVMVKGMGAMLGYGYQVRNVQDRWAIVAYVRELGAAASAGSDGRKPSVAAGNRR